MDRFSAVLDTNVVVRALKDREVLDRKDRNASHKIIERFKQGHFDMFINGKLFQEYRSKLEELVRAGVLQDGKALGPLLSEIERRAYPLRIPLGVSFPTNDPDDRSLFEVAYMRPLDFVVSHDKRDVLAFAGHHTLRGAEIVTAVEFLERLNQASHNTTGTLQQR